MTVSFSHKYMHRKWLQLCFIASFLIFSTKFTPAEVINHYSKAQTKVSENEIVFNIEPFYDINSIRLIVELSFNGNNAGQSKIILPYEFGGQSQSEGIKNIEAVSANTTIKSTSDKDEMLVEYPPGTEVKIKYQIEEFRSTELKLGNQFQIVLNKKYFHFLGETFFILPDSDWDQEYDVTLNWNHMPSTWSFANSLGINQKSQHAKLSLWNLRSSIFTGGDFRIIRKAVNNDPVYLAIRGNWNFSDNQLSDTIEKILNVERKFWNDYNFPYFLITVLPIEGSDFQTGTLRYNSYSLFLSKDRLYDYRLKKLIAYETFHTWIGDKIKSKDPEVLYYWFQEGFTDYYTRLFLLRAGLISLSDYVENYNNILEEYFTSSARSSRNEQLLDEFGNSSEFNRLPYLRGDIIAHNLNYAIYKFSSGKNNLDDMMRDLLKRSQTEGLLISNGGLSVLIRYYAGEDALSEVMKTLNTGANIKVNPDALGKCFDVRIESEREFLFFGEEYKIPVYFMKKNVNNCINWFLGK